MIHPHTIVVWAALTSTLVLLSASRTNAQEPTWSDTVEAIAISPDGQLLASGGASTVVAIWDVQTGLLARELTGHSKTIRALSFDPDGTLLASGSNDGLVKIWDVASGRLLRETNLEVAVSKKVEFSAEGSTLVTGDLGGRIIVWDTGTLTEIRTTALASAKTSRSKPECARPREMMTQSGLDSCGDMRATQTTATSSSSPTAPTP